MSEIKKGTSILADEYITIPFEEYKELLMIKGRYEELKSKAPVLPFGYTYTKTEPIPREPYKVTFSSGETHIPTIE